MSETADQDDTQDAIDVGIEAAAEAIDAVIGASRRWRCWGPKEMLIASTAAAVAVDKWRSLQSKSGGKTSDTDPT